MASALTATNRLGGGNNVGEQKDIGAAPEQDTESGKLPKLGGIYWWLLLGLMIASDIVSALANLLVLLGLGIAGEGSIVTLGIGAIVALPVGFSIAAMGWVVGVLVSFNAFMFSTGYYLFNKVSLLGARKLATMGVSVIIEFIPSANALPMLTIAFLIITFTENAKRGSSILGSVVQGAITKTGLVGAVAGKVLSKA